jgi:CMP-N-acetylneuraminic acid synthetase
MISIIVRTKNEERWIGSCLEAIAHQTEKDHEVVLVDNNSTDQTVNKALQYGVTLVTVDQFRPGAAINRGIEAAKGDILVCLSGHCIPVNEVWLANLVRGLEDDTVAGVYGRQEPLAFTSDLDKRDLLITFGLDSRVQVKDSFFHNANSAFRRSTWQRFPFDEEVRNIEDRIWASAVQKAGFKILYEPEASVYHHHGIHHEGDQARAKSIIRILETFGAEETKTAQNKIDASRLNTVAVVPVREEGLRKVSGKPLFQYAIEHGRQSELIKTVAVSTDSEAVARDAKAAGADIVLMRGADESRFDVILEIMMQSSLAMLEEQGIIPDALVMLEPTYPVREKTLLDRLIRQFVEGGFDTVIPAREEYNSCWMEEEGMYRRVDTGHIARQFKQPFFTGLKGVGCVSSPATVRQGELFGQNVGLFKLDGAIPMIEVRSDADVVVAETILSSPLYANAIR